MLQDTFFEIVLRVIVSNLLQIRRKTFSKAPALICSGIDGSGAGDSSSVGSLCSLMPTFCLLSSELTVAMFLNRPQISNPCYNTKKRRERREGERERVCVCVCCCCILLLSLLLCCRCCFALFVF